MDKYEVLFLTNNSNSQELYQWLSQRCTVEIYSERLELWIVQEKKPDLIISYNYKYLISEDIIEHMKGNIINLHISYLPWNRGSDPNFWSFVDDTPKGVTIHQVNAKLDNGKILYQKVCELDANKETFTTSYVKLNQEIIELFKEKWEAIRAGEYVLHEQSGKGSYHKKKELQEISEKIVFDWNENIAEFLQRYKEFGGN